MNAMEFDGIVYKLLPPVSGTSSKGAWRKQDVVFEIPSEFSRKICVTFFGDRSEDAAGLKEGDAVSVSVNVESREYNGKWYTDVRAWKMVKKSTESSSVPAVGPFGDAPFNEDSIPAEGGEIDDLPF